jgi:hypothetical protein
LDRAAVETPVSGRLLVLMTSNPQPVPLITPAAFGAEAQTQWIAAQEVPHWRPGEAVQIDVDEIAWPKPLSTAPDGNYQVMALLDVDHNAAYTALSAGDLRSPVMKMTSVRAGHELRLTERVTAPPLPLPAGQELIDFMSPSLSAFWGRPIHMRGIVVLPPGYAAARHTYPVIFWTHGYGASMATLPAGRARRSAEAMRSGELPPIIWVLLDQSLPSGTRVRGLSEQRALGEGAHD